MVGVEVTSRDEVVPLEKCDVVEGEGLRVGVGVGVEVL